MFLISIGLPFAAPLNAGVRPFRRKESWMLGMANLAGSRTAMLDLAGPPRQAALAVAGVAACEKAAASRRRERGGALHGEAVRSRREAQGEGARR